MKQYLYENPKDHRFRMVYMDDNGHHTSVSYPRILMEEKLGRPLEPNEDVHHIDGDVTNNQLDNLEVVLHGIHQKQHSTKYFDKIFNCDVCGKPFICTGKKQQMYYTDICRGKRRAFTCSKHCSYLFGVQEQIRGDSNAECGLNGEPSPNGNTVPNAEIFSMCVENIHPPTDSVED